MLGMLGRVNAYAKDVGDGFVPKKAAKTRPVMGNAAGSRRFGAA